MNFRKTFTMVCLIISTSFANCWAQTPVSYKELAADFYDADGSVAVVLLHGTLAHNRMEI